MAAQNWNTIIKIIKNRLGAPLNLLEMSDSDIVESLKLETLTRFSNHVPYTKYMWISIANLMERQPGYPQHRFSLPIKEDEVILDITDVYFSNDGAILDQFGQWIASSEDAIDTVIMNTFIDAVKSLQTRQTWQFIPPKTIIFDLPVSVACIEYSVEHMVLNTIPPDMFWEIFVEMCYGYVLKWIIAKRKKYSTLATPFGNIELNVAALEQEAQIILDKVEQKLAAVPPDHLVYMTI